MKYFVGQRVRAGGKLGRIMAISEIHGDDMILVDDIGESHCTFYYHKGDCSLIPFKDYEQLSLF